MAAVPFDNRVPRSRDAVDQLLAERPPGWPYLLYSAVLSLGIADLEDKYRDHEIGYATGSRTHFSDSEAFDELGRQMDILRAIVDGFGAVLDLDAQKRAMGWSGVDGTDAVPADASRTIHLANSLVRIYDELLDWAARLRRLSCGDDNLRRAAAVQAHFVDQPLVAIREFAGDMIEQCDSFVSRLLDGEQITLDRTITLRLSDQLVNDRTEAIRAWVQRAR